MAGPRLIAALAAALALSSQAWAAEVVSAGPASVSVAIYRDHPGVTADISDPDAEPQGLALITEERTIDVPEGASTISFRGVAEGIVPETAKIDGLPADIVEYNFDYDLLSPGSLIARSIGRTVRLVRTDRKTGRETMTPAIIRSGPEGVMLEVDGRLEAFHCGGPAERLVFDSIPPGLADEPTLSLRARAQRPGRYTVRLSYLANGFDWSADYVARLAPDGRTLDLSGWITLANHSGTSFADAPTSVVAGRWNRVDDDGTDREPPSPVEVEPRCWPMGTTTSGLAELMRRLAPPPPPPPPPPMAASPYSEVVVTGSRIAKMSELGDYKLYTLPESTNVAARQTKQVQFLEQPGVAFTRTYRYEIDPDDLPDGGESAPAVVLLKLKNEKASGLGKPLPAGSVSVLEPGGKGGPVLAGDPHVDDMAVGLPVELELGPAVGVSVTPRQVSETTSGSGEDERVRTVMEVAIINAKPVAVHVELMHRRNGENFRVVSESRKHGLKDGLPIWSFDLSPGARKVLTYTYEQAD